MRQMTRATTIILAAMPFVASFSATSWAEQIRVFCKPITYTDSNSHMFDIDTDNYVVVQTAFWPTGEAVGHFNYSKSKDRMEIDSEYIKIGYAESKNWRWIIDRRTGILTVPSWPIDETYRCDLIKREDLPRKF
jgi:hypothetical protein